jgi:tetratricopeptide (TPR) repeat protein
VPTPEQLARALLESPEDPILHFSAGNLHRDAGRLLEASHHYRQAARFQPRYSAAWFELARVAERLGDVKSAREAYEGALRASADRGDDHLLKAARVRLARLGKTQP